MNFEVSETLATDSESSWHGDFENGVGYGLAGCATETVIYLKAKCFDSFLAKSGWPSG